MLAAGGVSAAVLFLITLEMSLMPVLRLLGWDPLFGFLFSPYPVLRVMAVLQLLGGVCAVVAGLLATELLRPTK